MKISALILVLCGIALPVAGQDAKQTPAKTDTLEAASVTLELQAKPETKKILTKPAVSEEGFLPVVVRKGGLAKSLDLRQPSDPKKDRETVSTDPKTGHVAGFILFRLRF